MSFIFRHSAAIAVAVVAVGFSAHAKDQDILKPSKSAWDSSDLPKTEDISGIACVKRASGARHCIIAIDEGRSALFATLRNNKIKAKDKIRLLPKSGDHELDAEGAAYDPETASFYVVGSYGTKRYSCAANPLAYNFIRIPVDPKKGRPTFDYSKNLADESWVAPEIKQARNLKTALQNSAELGPFVDKCLGAKPAGGAKGEQGVNIEGLAILGQSLYLGFRGPVHDETAYLAVFDLKSVFAEDQTTARIIPVKLGSGTGVRDLAAVDDGLLILSGPEDSVPGSAAIHFFDPATASVKLLGRIPPVSPKAKPEALLLLEETAKHYRVLVLSDGVKRGKPTEFSIRK